MTSTDRPPLRSLAIAVVGAGVSGLACARRLHDAGHRVQVFEKARGPGGRMSTRRAGHGRFDHGAQYFTVRDPRFDEQVQTWLRDGVVALWPGRVAVLTEGRVSSYEVYEVERFVGVPGMSAVCRRLAGDVDVAVQARIIELERSQGRWRLRLEGGEQHGPFDAVVVSAPPQQTRALLAAVAPALSARAASARMTPCWAGMATFAEPLDVDFIGAFVRGSPLEWVARNGSKPGRPAGEAWVFHASTAWSEAHAHLDRDHAAAALLDAFRDAVGGSVSEVVHLGAHRWLYAQPAEPLTESCLFDEELTVAACGDWCGGPRVEGAYLSGLAAAERLLSPRPAVR